MDNSPDLSCLWGIVFFVGFGALMAGLGYRQRRALMKGWRELAERTGLTFDPGRVFYTPPRVIGIYRAHCLSLETFTRRVRRKDVRYTQIVLSVNSPASIYLALSPEGVSSQVDKFFGLKEVQTGDAGDIYGRYDSLAPFCSGNLRNHRGGGDRD